MSMGTYWNLCSNDINLSVSRSAFVHRTVTILPYSYYLVVSLMLEVESVALLTLRLILPQVA